MTVMSHTSKLVQPQKQYYYSYSAMSAEDTPPEIAQLLKQQQEIQQKLDAWRKEQEAKKMKEVEKQELHTFVNILGKKRAFNGLKYKLPPPKRLKRCFHNIKVIQQKEEELAKERAGIKEECIKDIQDYLEDIHDN